MTNPPKSSVKIRSTTPDQEKHPDIKTIESVILKQTERTRRVVTHTAIQDRHTKRLHHHAVNIKTIRLKKAGEQEDEKHSVTIEGDDEIHKLLTLLLKVRQGTESEGTDRFVVVSTGQVPNFEDLQVILNQAAPGQSADALTNALRKAVEDPAVFNAVMQRAAIDPTLFAAAATTLNLAAFKADVHALKALVDKLDVGEGEFQRLLTKSPWMFGSEYSKLLGRRHWTRDENQDFVVRRTVDDYIEVIEIKTPLNGSPLFKNDDSHNSYYAGAELSKVIGQVQKYIAKLDADRNTIVANDCEDTTKIRAKIIIGRDGDENQAKALRNFNGHLHRIEVITFDQLLKIAECVISYLEQSLLPQSNDLV